jgi:predicted PurR-regulated permease PerM
VKNHVRTEGNDKNGFPGGIRLSWAALTVVVATLGLVFAVGAHIYGVQAKAFTQLADKMDAGFLRLGGKIDKVSKTVVGHCADPFAHDRLREAGP